LGNERLYFLKKPNSQSLEVTIGREVRGHSVSVKGNEHEIEAMIRALGRVSEAIKQASNEELAALHP